MRPVVAEDAVDRDVPEHGPHSLRLRIVTDEIPMPPMMDGHGPTMRYSVVAKGAGAVAKW
jgi:hypothetical protein